jgi:hypothetical protein
MAGFQRIERLVTAQELRGSRRAWAKREEGEATDIPCGTVEHPGYCAYCQWVKCSKRCSRLFRPGSRRAWESGARRARTAAP